MQAHARLHQTAAWWPEGHRERGHRSSALQACHPGRAPGEIRALLHAHPPRKPPVRLPGMVCIASHSPPHPTTPISARMTPTPAAGLTSEPAAARSLPSLPFSLPTAWCCPLLCTNSDAAIPLGSQFSLFHWQKTNLLFVLLGCGSEEDHSWCQGSSGNAWRGARLLSSTRSHPSSPQNLTSGPQDILIC